MTDTPTRTEADSVAEVATRAAEPKPMTGDAWALPLGVTMYDLHDQLAAQRERPDRRRGRVAATDAASLARLVTDLGPEHGTTRIYADLEGPTITAVLNDHDDSGDDDLAVAGWGDHRITTTVKRTMSWQRWLAAGVALMDQVDFAHHLEDCLSDIAEPDGADLLELAQTFEAKIDAQFSTGVRLQDGTRQLNWVETVNASAGVEGRLSIPAEFKLAIAPFEGSEVQLVIARLRFKVSSGHLKIGYQLHRPDEVERTAFDSLVEVVAKETGIRPYLAKPPSA